MAGKRESVEGCEEKLSGRLTAYSEALRVTDKMSAIRRRAGNWPLYAAATGSALAMATGAQASILYCGPSNNYCDPNGPHHSAPSASHPGTTANNVLQPIGLDGNGHIITLKAGLGHTSSNLNVYTFGIVEAFAGGHVKVFAQSGIAKNFALSSLISANAPGHATAAGNSAVVNKKFLSTSGFGQFHPNQSGFAGLALGIYSSLGAQTGTEYGWIRLIFTNGQSGIPTKLTALDWGIKQDVGQSIKAGQTTDVAPAPEPGTMGLGLLALGAAGVLGLKRRRVAIKAQSQTVSIG